MTIRSNRPRAHRSIARVLCAALVLVLLASAVPPTTAAQGGGWTLPAPGGGPALTQGSLSQGATVVVLWASWSPRCRDIADRVNQLERRWGQTAKVVTVNFQEDAATVRSFLAGEKISPPVYLDEDGVFSKKYALTTLPGLIVFRDGEVVYRGKLPSDPDAVIGNAIG